MDRCRSTRDIISCCCLMLRRLQFAVHFFFLPPLRFGRLEVVSRASGVVPSGAAASAGRFFSAALAAAFSRSLAMSSVNLALMSLLSPC